MDGSANTGGKMDSRQTDCLEYAVNGMHCPVEHMGDATAPSNIAAIVVVFFHAQMGIDVGYFPGCDHRTAFLQPLPAPSYQECIGAVANGTAGSACR